jgi:hypothetical protein
VDPYLVTVLVSTVDKTLDLRKRTDRWIMEVGDRVLGAVFENAGAAYRNQGGMPRDREQKLPRL